MFAYWQTLVRDGSHESEIQLYFINDNFARPEYGRRGRPA